MATRRHKSVNIVKEFLHILLNLLFYGAAVLIAIQLCRGVYTFSYEVFGVTSLEEAPGRDIVVFFPAGENEMETAERLEINGIISNRYSFFVKSKLLESEVQPGKYRLNTSMTYEVILDTITAEPPGEETN